jgi:hypothetical protein
MRWLSLRFGFPFRAALSVVIQMCEFAIGGMAQQKRNLRVCCLPVCKTNCGCAICVLENAPKIELKNGVQNYMLCSLSVHSLDRVRSASEHRPENLSSPSK